MIKERIQELIQIGSLDEAKKLLSELKPDGSVIENIEICTMKAAIAVAEDNLQEAEDELWRGLLIDSEFVDILFNLGYVYKLRNNIIQSNYFFAKAKEVAQNAELVNVIEQLVDDNRKLISLTEQPLVSIVVLAYNKLEYTKLCIDSILQYTQNVNYELILVNNGSTDGTKDYFNSLPNAKPLHLIKNVGVTNGFNEGMKAAEGKYTACVCNDFIFTPRWLDNLLVCIESDERIGYVSPGASMISNMQQINGDYNNIEEMIQFANKYNHSDPRKWEERVRLLPCVLMVRTELLRQIGYYDPSFYYGEFADDDISFRIRRAGYKLVYCKDTFTYHFGSVTVRDDQINNNSLNVSRDIFIRKYNLDSWSDAIMNPLLLNEFSVKLSMLNPTILGINAKCGGNPLQLKNMLKYKGIQNTEITNYCLEDKYLEDIKTVSDYYFKGNVNEISTHLLNRSFDYILFEYDATKLDNTSHVFEVLTGMLNKGGQLGMSLSFPEFDELACKKIISSFTNRGLSISYYNVLQMKESAVDFDIIVRKDV
ncbi:glycosyltransferase [Paenibacillus pedocola]|uniref:glycosyltransferase n=1 Tax=Paenibacillus pedocola TaxID=3242193 RepID=UPI002877A2E6|nr:glycosyltransferase [Paenibacillus typhae]